MQSENSEITANAINPTGNRFLEIDFIKAISIVGVILIHSSCFLDAVFTVEKVIQSSLNFAVPCFYFASGFLFARQSGTTTAIARKIMIRLLIPYVILGSIYFIIEPHLPWIKRFADLAPLESAQANPHFLAWYWKLFLGYGIFYFVFVLIIITLIGLIIRNKHKAIFILATTAALAMLLLQSQIFDLLISDLSIRWQQLIIARAFWGPFLIYLLGWHFSIHYDVYQRFLSRFAQLIIPIFLTIWIAYIYIDAVQELPMSMHTHIAFRIAGIGLLLTTGIVLNTHNRILLFLSSASYTIYLLHIHFVIYGQSLFFDRYFDSLPERIVLPFFLALFASCTFVVVARKISTRYSRLFFGA